MSGAEKAISCRRLLLGHAGSHPEAKGRPLHEGALHRRRQPERHLPATTAHAEAIEIIFDPQQVTFRDLLEFFFQIHDPTTLNRQGNDVGRSYRSAIFYSGEAERRVAAEP
jgi:hypothetical protein